MRIIGAVARVAAWLVLKCIRFKEVFKYKDMAKMSQRTVKLSDVRCVGVKWWWWWW